MSSRAKVPFLEKLDWRNLGLLAAIQFFFLVGAAIAASSWDECVAGWNLRKALTAYHEGRSLEAIERCEAAARAKPGYLDPRLLSISVRARLNQFSSPEALGGQYASLARESREGEEALWARCGQAAADLAAGKGSDAFLGRLRETARLFPRSAEPRLHLAAFWAARGDLEQAQGFLQEVLTSRDLDPPSAETLVQALLGFSAVRESQGKMLEAAEPLEQARWMLGRRRVAWSNVGDLRALRFAETSARAARVDLLARMNPWQLRSDDLREGMRIAEEMKSASEADPQAAGRLVNLLAVALLRLPADGRDPQNRKQAAEWLAEADQRLLRTEDPVASLNRLAMDLPNEGQVLEADSQTAARCKSWKEEYLRIRPWVASLGDPWTGVVFHNAAVLSGLSGGSLDACVRELEALAARFPDRSSAIAANIAVLYDRAGEAAKAASWYRRVSGHPQQERIQERLAALGKGGGGTR